MATITTPSNFHIQYHARPEVSPLECLQCIRESWERAERERDEARAAFDRMVQGVVDWQGKHDAAEQDAARLAEAVRGVLPHMPRPPIGHLCHDELRAALAAHEERVRGGGA